MKLAEAKAQFIQTWGSLATQWGINKTMAQIHALLLITPNPLSQDDLMEELSISRGNANMNIRELIDWGLVDRVIIPGERKEFFLAEKDIWKVARQIVKERKKRELEPLNKVLEQLQDVEGDKRNAEVKAFTETIGNIRKFTGQADKSLDTLIRADENWFWGSLIKMIK
ncbi:MarR family transcriptional regulator [Flavihumibacter sp. CACIAM 22H1]|uniref:GbsR/MarR family transcriptional regulator n=1 Tax=Flavihumibacter sp. CACIAM 22H1 TaxID=1812911 RepID=UPI0007A90A12|nr:MarR family transcriptional regulator [Flavihumibacter sp. CACIAM 22H1]KYP16491.1 MAG: transcriptional regulator [Flavihumibacter sp. CACIAM 22H1]